MKPDTRSLNNTAFPTDSISSYFDGYRNGLVAALEAVDKKNLEDAEFVLRSARKHNAQIFVAGNGGSAAISDHLECDFSKGCHHGGKTLNARSLSSNASIITALGNDIGFENVFKKQLELYAKPFDILILISSSGNSENIVQAAQYAKDHAIFLIGLTGFSGGKLKDLADVALHVPVANYGIVEDSHQALMHILAQFTFLTASRL